MEIFDAAKTIKLLKVILDYPISSLTKYNPEIAKQIKNSIDLLKIENDIAYTIFWNADESRISAEDYKLIKSQFDELSKNRTAIKLWNNYQFLLGQHTKYIAARAKEKEINDSYLALQNHINHA